MTSILLIATLTLGSGGDSEWLTDYGSALEKAAKSDKLILADFTGSDWCGWCVRLKEEVFDKPEFKKWATDNVVLLELDFPRSVPQSRATQRQNLMLAERFSIRGYPTVVFMDSKGQEVGRTGYVKGGPEKWIANAEALLKKNLAKKDKAQERPAVKTASGWYTNYEHAAKVAKESGRPILADFTGSDWCGWCIKLKKEVFEKAEFKKWAKDNVILLELDFPRRTEQSEDLRKQNAALAKKYGIRGYPTILFLNAEGEVLARSGYKPGGPLTWTEDADKLLGRGS